LDKNLGKIKSINGPVITGTNMNSFKVREMVLVGDKKLIGEVVSIEGNEGIIQVYEETEGLDPRETIAHTYNPLSLKLGHGMIGNMFDGIQRPLNKIREEHGTFIPEGIGFLSIDEEKLWDVDIKVKVGDYVKEGQIVALVPETSIITHRILIPFGVNGEVVEVCENGKYNIEIGRAHV